jgi:multicomponent Na+:H+ antiporter subunit D
MNAGALLSLVLLAPLVQGLGVWAFGRFAGLRDGWYVAFALATAGLAAALAVAAPAADGLILRVGASAPGAGALFRIEPLGVLMALAIAWLSAIHAVFLVGYGRAGGVGVNSRSMGFAALSVAAALCAALAGSLATVYVALAALTMTTFGLVAAQGDYASRRAAGVHLAVTLAAASALLFPALVAIDAAAADPRAVLRFPGLLPADFNATAASVLLVMTVLGVAAAAVPPTHLWARATARAPESVGALLHGAVMAPLGAFVVLKLVVYGFGPAIEQARLGADILVAVCGATLAGASLLALSRQEMRERIAYVLVAQLAGATGAALLPTPAGVVAAIFQIFAVALGALVAFMAAGAVRAATGRTLAADYAGLGRLMPWTMAGFAVAVISIIGFAPFAGAWGKLWLVLAMADRGVSWFAVAYAAGAISCFAALGVTAVRAFSAPAPDNPFRRADGASIVMVAPITIGAVLLAGLLVLLDPITSYLAPLWEAAP